MASYYDMHQWYQSRRSSAAHQKIEKEIEETEIHESSLRRRVQLEKSPDDFDAKLRRLLKRLDEIIDSNKKSPQKMIGDGFSPGNSSDYAPDHVSTDLQKFDCEETLIEVPSLSAYEDESKQLVDMAETPYNQVYFESGNSELHKQYTVYSSYELNEKRDRGICLLCDEYMYQGHKCCKKKKFYVFEIDVDDSLEVNECNVSESPINVELVEKKVADFDEKLTGHGIQSDSILVKNLISKNKIEGEGMDRVGDIDHKAENVELQVFEELPNKDLPQNVTEKCKSYTLENMDEKCGINCKDFDNKRLRILDDVIPWCLVVSTTTKVVCLDDVCSGEGMFFLITNPSSKGVGSLHKLHEMLGAQSWVVEWPEPPLPPPEPPPGLSYTVFNKENKPENLE